uniref:Uncharacterized protein n=1 Tax=Thermus islandicus TaxID=540988 RepID=A0A831U4J6_9DEIN
MSGEDREDSVQEREKVAEPPQVDSLGHPRTRARWREAYRTVFGEVDDLFEERVRLAMRLMEAGIARSRVEALLSVSTPPLSSDAVGGPEGAVPLGEGLQAALTLGALVKAVGRLEAQLDDLRQAVARLEAELSRTETRLLAVEEAAQAVEAERRRTLLEVEERLLALESWVRRMSRYLGKMGEKGGPFGR